MFQQLPRMLLILNIVLSLRYVLHYLLKSREELASKLIDYFLGPKLFQSYRLLLKSSWTCQMLEDESIWLDEN
jgi:hypothetical protein